jgi:hypothetical protein
MSDATDAVRQVDALATAILERAKVSGDETARDLAQALSLLAKVVLSMAKTAEQAS